MSGIAIKLSKEIKEGEVLNSWFKRRMVNRNQNVLIAVTGGTGTGKSYGCQRIAELWYEQQFGKRYPVEANTCFSIDQLMHRLVDKNPKTELKKGELLILEEAGANFGSLDFQRKVSKMFGYVLQSFRSMNIGILFNLPVLTMMNKSARLLIHAHLITCGIDYTKKVSKFKPLFRQVNQQQGKVYEKYLRVRVGRVIRPVKRVCYSLPSKENLKLYEQRKLAFVSDLNADFVVELRKTENAAMIKSARQGLTDTQQEVFNCLVMGENAYQIAEKTKKTSQAVYDTIKIIKRKGYQWEKAQISLEKQEKQLLNPIPVPI